MAGGYEHRPDGTDGVAALLKSQQRQIDALRSGAGIKSAILRGAELTFQDEDGERVAVIGTTPIRRITDGGGESSDVARGALYYDPASDELMFLVASFQSNGDTIVQAGDAGNHAALDFFRVFANDVGISGNDVDIISSNQVSIRAASGVVAIDHLTTAVAANAGLAVDGTLYRVTSGLKYKTDIADADVDVDDVLALQPRTWVDKAAIDRAGEGDIARNVGFIAEELDELPSLRQFVVYEDGEPDSIQYDRLSVALLEVLKAQDQRLTDIEARLQALEGS